MGRKFITDQASPFYPPRARWFSLFFVLGCQLRRRLALDRLRMPRGMAAGELVAGFFVPGLAVYFRGPVWAGRAALGAGAALLLVYMVWLGYPAANLAFGLLISLHVTGFVHYCQRWLAAGEFGARLAFTAFVMLAMVLLLYLPARGLVQQRLITPLRLQGQVIVVRRTLPVHPLQHGQWLAYSLPETETGEAHNGGAIWFHGGTGFGPVLAVGGDHVIFSTNGYSVNGVAHPALPHMPVAGECQVPEKHWFIWPNLAISGHGNVGEGAISGALLALADVAPRQFLGLPFDRWFWRPQTLPSSP